MAKNAHPYIFDPLPTMSFGTIIEPVIYQNLVDATTTASGGVTTLTANSPKRTVFTGASAQTVRLPVTTTLVNGFSYEFYNNSTANVLILTSAGAAVGTLSISGRVEIICINTLAVGTAAWMIKRPINMDVVSIPSFPNIPNESVWYGTRGAAPSSVVLGNSITGSSTNSVTIGNAARGGTSTDIISIGSSAGSLTSSSTNYYIGSGGSAFIGATSNIGIGANTQSVNYSGANNITIGHNTAQSLGANTYSVGTASQSGTTVTGSGVLWESFNRGSPATIVFATGQQAPLTTKLSSTAFTSTVSQSVGASLYTIYYGVLYNTGTAASSGVTVTGVGTVWTTEMVGGYIIFSTGAVRQITGVNSATSLTISSALTVGATIYKIYYANPDNNIVIGGTGSSLTDNASCILLGNNVTMVSHGTLYTNGIAIGTSNTTGAYGIALGTNNVVSIANTPGIATAGIAIGDSCTAYGTGSGFGGISIGRNGTAITTGPISSVIIGFANTINGGAPSALGGIGIGHGVQVGSDAIGLGLDCNGGAGCIMLRVNNGATSGTNSIVLGTGSNAAGASAITVGNNLSAARTNTIFVGRSMGSNENISNSTSFGISNYATINAASTGSSNVIVGIACFSSYSIVTTNSQFAPTNNVVLGITVPSVMQTGARNNAMGVGVFVHGNNNDSTLIGSNTTAGADGTIHIGTNSGAAASFTAYIGTSADSGVTIAAASNVMTITVGVSVNNLQINVIVYLPGTNTEVTVLALLSGTLGAAGSTYTVSQTLSMSRRVVRSYGTTTHDIGIGFRTLGSLYFGGGKNIAAGRNAGFNLLTGNNNIIIGEGAQVGTTATYRVAIGNNITNTVDSSVLVGANGVTLARFEIPVGGTEAGGTVTINAALGTITLSAPLAASVSIDITCNCNRVQSASIIRTTVAASTGYGVVVMRNISAGSFQFTVVNISGVSITPSVNFMVGFPVL